VVLPDGAHAVRAHAPARTGATETPTATKSDCPEQLANFQLFRAVFVAFVYMIGCYAVAAARYGHPDLAAVHDER
jgi:hypothetical protein